MKKVFLWVLLMFLGGTTAIVYANKTWEFGYHPEQSRVDIEKDSQVRAKEGAGGSAMKAHKYVGRESGPPEIRGPKTQVIQVLHPDKIELSDQ